MTAKFVTSSAGFPTPPSVPVRHGDRVVQFGIEYRLAIEFHNQEMKLMDMEGMRFTGTILDRPIFDCTYLSFDRRRIVDVEYFRLLTFHRNKIFGRTIRSLRGFREVEFSSGGCRLRKQPAKALSWHGLGNSCSLGNGWRFHRICHGHDVRKNYLGIGISHWTGIVARCLENFRAARCWTVHDKFRARRRSQQNRSHFPVSLYRHSVVSNHFQVLGLPTVQNLQRQKCLCGGIGHPPEFLCAGRHLDHRNRGGWRRYGHEIKG